MVKKQCYFVMYGNDDYGISVIAHSLNQAKAIAWKYNINGDYDEYINLRVRINTWVQGNWKKLPIGIYPDNTVDVTFFYYECVQCGNGDLIVQQIAKTYEGTSCLCVNCDLKNKKINE